MKSHGNPIPDHLKYEFVGWMDTHDCDDLSDGAWMQVLTDAAEEFIKEHKLNADAHDSMMKYLIWRSENVTR